MGTENVESVPALNAYKFFKHAFFLKQMMSLSICLSPRFSVSVSFLSLSAGRSLIALNNLNSQFPDHDSEVG